MIRKPSMCGLFSLARSLTDWFDFDPRENGAQGPFRMLRHSVQMPGSLAKSRHNQLPGVERLAKVAARSSAGGTQLIPQDVTITRVTTKGS